MLNKRSAWKVMECVSRVMGRARFWDRCPKDWREQKHMCHLSARVIWLLGGLSIDEWLALFLNCVRKEWCVDVINTMGS